MKRKKAISSYGCRCVSQLRVCYAGIFVKAPLLLTLLYSSHVALARQPDLSFTNYSPEDGLSQLSCYALAQDANGFLWVGTQDGLNRYDGRQFKVYAQQNEIGKNLPSNAITALYFDSLNNLLWTGTSRGLCLYDPLKDSITKFSDFFPFAKAIEALPIKKIVSLKENEYWIISYKQGLYCLNTKSATVRSFFTKQDNESMVTDIALHERKIIVSLLYSLYEMKPENNSYSPQLLHQNYRFPQIEAIASYHHQLWVGTISDGCYYIKNRIEDKENVVASDIVFGGVFCFGIDSNNELWIGSRGSGIYKYNAVTHHITRMSHNQFVPNSPATNFVVSLLKDRQGNMWCGLSGGLSKYDPLSGQFGYVNGPTSANGSLLDKMIYSMYKAKDGTQFIGTQNKGLFEWQKATNKFIHFPASAIIGKANNVIYNITEDDHGNIWAATCGGLMQLDRKTQKISYYPENKTPILLNKMYALTKLKGADSLLISADDGLRFFSLKDKRWVAISQDPNNMDLSRGFALFRGGRSFYEDEKNTVWLCASGSGLMRYHYLDNTFEPVETVNNVTSSVRHILPDGSLFLLATDNGLIVYDHEKDKVIKHVSVKGNGISNVCYAVQQDNEGFYWISTNAGLRKLNKQFEVIQTYNTSNGLSFLEYNSGCTSKDADGTLYFGGTGGITFFHPSMLKQNTFSPTPIITGVTVNEKPWPNPPKDGAHRLTYDENFLAIQFAATNFSNEKNNQFSYRLKGLTDHWSALSTANTATFTSLPPSQYVFELRSANSDGKWSDGVTTLVFTILTPWWQTWWFSVCAIVLLAGIVIWFVRRRIQIIRKEVTLKQQLAEAEMMAMRSQMNPHFLFNSLNSIREMILNNEKHEASHFLSKFASLIRTTLTQSDKPFVSLRQTMDHLGRYIEIEQIRNETFTSRILADDELNPDEVMLPSMLIQPFVENALWHGTTSSKRNINININFKRHEGKLLCIVEDDGIGIKQSLKNKVNGSKTHQSVGLANIAHRIQLLNEKYSLESNIYINDKTDLDEYSGGGTVVQVFLPLQIDES